MRRKIWIKKTRKKLLRKRTKAELTLEKWLRESRIIFQTQRPVQADGSIFFVDFVIVCESGSYGIEVDGDYHNNIVAQDALRTDKLTNANAVLAIIRIHNNKIVYNLNSVKTQILELKPVYKPKAIRKRPNIETAAPSSERNGGAVGNSGYGGADHANSHTTGE